MMFTNVSLETSRVCTVSVIGLGSGPGNVSAGTTYTINGGPVKYLTWAHGTKMFTVAQITMSLPLGFYKTPWD